METMMMIVQKKMMMKSGAGFNAFNIFNSPAKTVQRHSFEFLTAHNIYSHQMIRRAHAQKCCHPVAIHGPLSATLTLIFLYFA